jgi:hypothetical protein
MALTTEEKSQKRKETILNRNVIALMFLVLVAMACILRWGIIDIPTNAINEALTPELQRFSNHETYRYLFFVDQPQMGDNNSPVYAVAYDYPDSYFLITMLVDEKLPSMHRANYDRSACYAEIPISKETLSNLTPDQAIKMISPCNMEITTTLYDSQFGFSNGYTYFNNTIQEIIQ